MKQKIIGIYQIRNLINNKKYIGSSIDIKTRWTEHKYDLKNNIHRNKRLQNAYNKYGSKNFVYEILETLTSDKELRKREQFWITTTNVCNKKVGYNIQEIVEVPPPATKKVVCLETQEIFNSIEDAGNKYSIDPSSISCCCNKRKLKQTGGYHWLFYEEYIKLSKEEIQEVINNTRWLKIVCLETKEIFKSYHETGYNKCTVQQCCSNLKKGIPSSCHGKHFMYKKDYDLLSEDDINKIINYEPKGIEGSGEVICVETKEVYKNANVAKTKTGIDSSQILDVCYKKAITAKGYHWLFKRDYDNLTKNEINQILNTLGKDSYCKKVICLETRETFKSGREAAIKKELHPSTVSLTCKRGGINTSTNSLHFMFLSDYEKLTEQDILNILNKKSKQTKSVKCIETNEVFSSVTEAAESIKAQTTNISKCCKNPEKTCKGYHWQYI